MKVSATQRRQIFLLIFFRSFRSVAAGMVTLAFPYLILKNLHFSSLTLGFIYTAATLATAGLGLLCGFLADVWGRKKTLIFISVLLPIACAMAYLSHHLVWIYASAMLGGFSATGALAGGGVGGAAQPIQSALIADLSAPEDRTLYFSIFTFISGSLAALGILLARFFPAKEDFLAATLISLVGLWGLVPLKLKDHIGNAKKLHGKKTIGKFAVTGLLNGFSQGLVTPFLVPFFVIVYHVPRQEMAIYGFISGILGSVAMLAAPYLERKLGFVYSIAITRGIGAFLLILLPAQRNFILALAIYFLTPALRVAALPAQQTAMTEFVPGEERGRALAFNQVARLGSSSAGTVFTGAMFSLDEIGLPFYLYGVVMAVNIGLYFFFFGKSGGNNSKQIVP